MLELFFFMLYFILYKTKDTDILFTMDLCMLYDENFILVVVVFICSQICPFLLLKCFYGIPHVFGISL